jgi:hypothetical protein
MDDEPVLAPEEFVAEENLNYEKQVNEGVDSDDDTVKTSNLPAPPNEEPPSQAVRRGPLTFDPSSPTEEGEDIHLAAADDQAKLMRRHYHLGHLTSQSSNSSPSTGKSPRSWQQSRHPSALPASLAQ